MRGRSGRSLRIIPIERGAPKIAITHANVFVDGATIFDDNFGQSFKHDVHGVGDLLGIQKLTETGKSRDIAKEL